jgi:hypothetical protein
VQSFRQKWLREDSRAFCIDKGTNTEVILDYMHREKTLNVFYKKTTKDFSMSIVSSEK